MGEKLFFSQDIIDAWCDESKVIVENDVLTINRQPPARFKLIPAYRILKVAGGGEDPKRLVNKVKTKAELEALGADIYMNSIIIGESAYDAEYGFLAHPIVSEKKEEKSSEALLTEFLLKNL
mgnify:CR=1 FL=1